jgi:hypothetical protein
LVAIRLSSTLGASATQDEGGTHGEKMLSDTRRNPAAGSGMLSTPAQVAPSGHGIQGCPSTLPNAPAAHATLVAPTPNCPFMLTITGAARNTSILPETQFSTVSETRTTPEHGTPAIKTSAWATLTPTGPKFAPVMTMWTPPPAATIAGCVFSTLGTLYPNAASATAT